MPINPRTPVLIGQGQIVNRIANLNEAREPVSLIAEAIQTAIADAEIASLRTVDALHVVRLLSWKYHNPALSVAKRLGIHAHVTGITPHGGNMPQLLVNKVASEIQGGELEIAIVAGGEASNSRARAQRENYSLPWPRPDSDGNQTAPATVVDDAAMNSETEIARQIVLPVQVYPMFESALRARAGRSLGDHENHIGRLWSRFSGVARTNDFAWSKNGFTAEEILEVTPSNRMIGLPYRKLMNSNNQVDMAAALIVCSVEKATQLGVPKSKWVFPISGTDCHDHYYVSNRHSLAETPAVRLGGKLACQLAEMSIDDFNLIDLYSCFPSAVQLGAQSLGLSIDRQLTITGGLSFAGGPWNNYVMHAIATMVTKLRRADDKPEHGFIWANGGYATKHSFGIYSNSPSRNAYRHASPQAEVDALPKRELATAAEAATSLVGRATIEAYTVMHDRDGKPETAIASTLLGDSRRAWATSKDPQVAASLCSGEWVGRQVTLDSTGNLLP
ncbi:MAG: acetyl-CoA acetyltransferase [Actinobacteria bacterium]|nr:acetyl-CoA acetyltransferase [Actinomycetota bacterium]